MRLKLNYIKMKKYLLTFLTVWICGGVFGQPFLIGHTTITLVDGSRGNRNIPTEIYYPAEVAGVTQTDRG